MATAACPDRATLELLLLGKLPRPQFDTLSEHLRTCDACAASADTLSLQDDWTNALRTPPAPEEQPQLLAQAIERAKALRGESETTPPDASLPTHIGSMEQLADLTSHPNGPKIDPEEIRFLAPPLLPDEIGRLGSYRILQVLGVGGMGIVFRAEDPRLKRQVALKAMKPAVAASPAAKDRFLREAQFTAALEHDNIVQIYQVDEDGGVPYIAMQFLRGESLKTRLERVGRLPECDVLRIGKEIAAGLATAHKRGLIHRDIKPDNIWLETETDRVKILDFGLVRAADDDAGLTQSGVVVGTPRYMAPEQAQGHDIDARCDLFSLGSVLYHLAAGKPPFAGNNVTATLMAVVQQAPPPLAGTGADVSPALEALILQLLAKDRQQRPQSAVDVCATLCQLEHDLRQSSDRTNSTRSLTETAEFPPPAAPIGDTVTHPEHRSDSGRRWTATRIVWAGGAGAALILAGVIIITITSKDGTKSAVMLPEGVQADVSTAPGSKVSITQIGAPFLSQPGWHGWPADAPSPAIAPFDAEQARQHQEAWAAYLKVPVEYTNSIGMGFMLIPPGEFTMGSTPEEIAAALQDAGEDRHWQECVKSEAPLHKVILTQPSYLGVNEVTQADYEQVMGLTPAHFAPMGKGKEAVVGLETADHPVEMVSWNDAAEFCAKLSQQEQLKPFYLRTGETIAPLDGTGYRLPTEAQREFACRAGTATRYWIGNQDEDLMQTGWIGRNAGGRTLAARGLKANPFGLSDIHGNVWEWVQDGWDARSYVQYTDQPAINPSSPFSAGSRRVLRGGDWGSPASSCRSASRFALDPTDRGYSFGFRVSLSVDAVRKSLGTISEGTETALEFDGVDDCIEIPRLTLRNEKPITVEAWLSPQTWKHCAIINISGKRPISLYLDEGTAGFWCLGSKIEIPAAASLIGQRIHVAGVYDGEDLTVYLNGQPSSKVKPLVPEGGEALMAYVGAIPDWENNFLSLRGFYHGQLHAIRVSETIRYTAAFEPPQKFETDAETLACYQFQTGKGDIVVDLTDHTYHGKIVGAKWVTAINASVNIPDFNRYLEETDRRKVEENGRGLLPNVVE